MLTVFAARPLRAQLDLHREGARNPGTGPEGLQAANEEPLRIEATGQQWLWRYDYPNESFSYYKLVVPVDTEVVLDLVSTDVVHTWDVPSLAGKADAVPGRHNRVIFRADEEGTFRGQSATLSGQALRGDADRGGGRLAGRYEAFVERPKDDIQAAQDRVVGLIEEGEDAMSARRPELVVEGCPRAAALGRDRDQRQPQGRRRDPDRAALGFLFIALVELLLMRLQLAIPENTFLSPVTFNRMLSLYGVTAIFLFALPLAVGFFYYLAPLQIGARGTALPRLGQTGAWLYLAGATVLYAGFLFTPSEAGDQPAGAALRTRLPAQQRGRRLGGGDRAGDAGVGPDRDRPGGHPAHDAGAGDGLAPAADLLLGRRDLLLAADRDRAGDAGRGDDAADRPQLRRDLLRR